MSRALIYINTICLCLFPQKYWQECVRYTSLSRSPLFLSVFPAVSLTLGGSRCPPIDLCLNVPVKDWLGLNPPAVPRTLNQQDHCFVGRARVAFDEGESGREGGREGGRETDREEEEEEEEEGKKITSK